VARLLHLALLAGLAESLVSPSLLAGQDLSGDVGKLLDATPFNRNHWGLVVLDANGRILANRHAEQLFMPASNTKLLVAAAAAVLLPPGFTVRTSLYGNGPVVAGTLTGDLVLYGRGDPTLSKRCCYKSRLQFDADSDVDWDLIGGWGFSNVLPTHNTGVSGFGEALAAAMALGQARGEEDPEDEVRMRAVIEFLLHQQLDPVNCFACTDKYNVIGGITEHAGAPTIRIDYVQHAWAALGHGGRRIGLVEPS
jgi:hypothetical protein